MKCILSVIFIVFGFYSVQAQNPVLPGYYADPSIKQMGDSFYIYVTTDGYPPFGNDGQTFAWTSANLMDWKPQVLKGLPNKTIWAPAIIKGKNNRYYLYCQNSVDYTGYAWSGDSPEGPFTKQSRLGGFDLEPFEDPISKKIFIISATKELFEMDNDVKSSTYLTKVVKRIPLQGNLFDFTEGPYMFYKDGLYYCMWAGGRCWQKSYNVRYAVSKNIEGPYTDGKNNPIVQTDEKAGITGPGHHSIIQIDGRYFIFYHREDDSRGANCNYRFTCASEITFDKEGEIHLKGYVDDIGKLLNKKSNYVNLALHKNVFANTEGANNIAKNAVDGRNDTRWTTGANEQGVLSIDLDKIQDVNAVEIDFEFADKWHTFKVEYSDDNQNWHMLEDHTQEAIQAYKAMFIQKDFKARYMRLTVTNSEDRNASVWEFKVLANAR